MAYRLVVKTANMIKTANKPKMDINRFNNTLFSVKFGSFERKCSGFEIFKSNGFFKNFPCSVSIIEPMDEIDV